MSAQKMESELIAPNGICYSQVRHLSSLLKESRNNDQIQTASHTINPKFSTWGHGRSGMGRPLKPQTPNPSVQPIHKGRHSKEKHNRAEDYHFAPKRREMEAIFMEDMQYHRSHHLARDFKDSQMAMAGMKTRL